MSIDYISVYEDFYSDLTESNQNLLSSLHKILKQHGFKWKDKTGLRYWYKGKKEFMIFYQNQRDGSARIKIRLAHIEEYEQILETCSDTIKKYIYNATECHYCGNCTNQIHLNYEGKTLNICNSTSWWVFCMFLKLENLSENDIESLTNLIKHELPFYLTMRIKSWNEQER